MLMKKKSEEPFVPEERQDTVRHIMLSMLEEGPHTARELSGRVGIPEKEVYDHLDHIKKTTSKSQRKLIVTPPECKKCGFVFTKLERLRKPGKCPRCKGESIRGPMFTIESGEKGPLSPEERSSKT
jgi:predicted Zn-ribbon and HTH transcriptional regulator